MARICWGCRWLAEADGRLLRENDPGIVCGASPSQKGKGMSPGSSSSIRSVSRRDVIRGSAAAAALAWWPGALVALAAGDEEGSTVIPFLDAQPVDPKR